MTNIPSDLIEKLKECVEKFTHEKPINVSFAEKMLLLAAIDELLTHDHAAQQPKCVGYFSYGTEHSFNWHQTAQEATENAEEMIDDYRGDACDGWSEEVDSICWGIIIQTSTKVDEHPRTDDDCHIAPYIDTVCDYALLPAKECE